MIARHAAITAGLTSVPGLANNRHCAASLAAVQSAAASVRAGMDQLILAGGVNSASTAPKSPLYLDGQWIDWYAPTHPDRLDAPNRTCRSPWGGTQQCGAGISREEMDAWALRSHRNAVAAIDEGRFNVVTGPTFMQTSITSGSATAAQQGEVGHERASWCR